MVKNINILNKNMVRGKIYQEVIKKEIIIKNNVKGTT